MTLGSGRSEPRGVASDGQNVYWAESPWGDPVAGGLYRCAVGGCSNSPTTLVSPGGQGVALGASHVYFTQAGATGTDGRILAVAK